MNCGVAKFSSRVQLCGALPQPALRCFWSVHRALILAVSYFLKPSICSFSGPALLRPASKQWPPCGALPRAWPSLCIPFLCRDRIMPARSNEPKDHDFATSPDGRPSSPSGHRREVLHANPEGLSNSKAVVVRIRIATETRSGLVSGGAVESRQMPRSEE